jgi:AAA family ATP:ADP antiporter
VAREAGRRGRDEELLIRRALKLEPGEGGLVALAAAYHFFLMAAYFIVKPLREEMGVRGGARNLEYLWLGTLVVSLAVLPPYWKLVARLPRRRFIPIVNRAILVTLVGFWALLRWLPADRQVWAARAFYVWVSVFNLFVLSVFWSFMADAFLLPQGRRLFGLVASGGTAGALVGAWFTMNHAAELKTTGLILVSAALLEVATQFAQALGRRIAASGAAPVESPARAPTDASTSLRSQWAAGFRLLARSPYLLGAAGYLLLSTLASSYVYAQRTELMQEQVTSSATRTSVFAWSDFATQGLAFVFQTLLAARALRTIGTGLTLALQMIVAAAGFVVLAFSMGGASVGAELPRALLLPLQSPSSGLFVVVLFFTLLKATEYGLSKPARESLFTVVSREEKYQCKSLIDTGLYRAFDQLHITTFSRLHLVAAFSLGLSLRAVSLVAAPLMLVGVGLSAWLGRKQAELSSLTMPRSRS